MLPPAAKRRCQLELITLVGATNSLLLLAPLLTSLEADRPVKTRIHFTQRVAWPWLSANKGLRATGMLRFGEAGMAQWRDELREARIA